MRNKQLIIFGLSALFLANCSQEDAGDDSTAVITYPDTKKGIFVDTLFGQIIEDPYRWLEDDKSEETKSWVEAQNKVTFAYLKKIPFRTKLKNKLETAWNYEKLSSPFKRGDYTYYYKNDGLQNQSVVYRKDDDDIEEVFLDPNNFSEDGTTSLGSMSFTEDGSLLAYSISEGGSDWRKVIVIDGESKEIIEDTLVDIKFSGISWKGNEGFFYSSYDKPEGSELSAKTDQHKLYYHKLGSDQANDQVIFGATEAEKRRYVGGSVSKDDRYLFISAQESTSGNELFVKDLKNPTKGLMTVVDGFDQEVYVLHTNGDEFYFITNLSAPNKRLVKTTVKALQPKHWKDVIPETENVLSVSKGSGYFFAKYIVDAVSQVKQFEYSGELVREIKLPGMGTAGGFSAKEEDEEVYFSFTNYSTPSSIYTLDPESGKTDLYWQPDVEINPENYTSEQIFYTSKDGTKVPMIITYKKGTQMNGKNPTILYGYGGFNISLTPSFSVANAVWMDLGGVYAVANLRGGGEYGKEWHKAGTKMKKQNVFDDFISAAEFLIEKKYTSSEYLAIRGGSNGGLLVGASMTQRPDLFKVALPAVGVLDMLRYHKFTSGAGWAYDYGTADDSKEMMEYLMSYSPVHNVKPNASYPSTLITTGDHDDRVVPAHSYKFAANLQAHHEGDNPVMIRIETKAGHGAGTPVSKTIEQYADIFSFTLYNMGIDPTK